jgi:predicted transcriptional regulator
VKITSDNEALAENKVLILYILSNVSKPITNDALYSIVLSATNLNYFYFQQFLLDLIDAKYIVSSEKGTNVFYQLTQKGKETLDLTIDILPGIEKLKVDTTFKTNIEHFENAESIVAEFSPKGENEYEVNCKIVEDGETVFSIKTLAYSRDQAQNIVANWRKNAGKLYPELIELITKPK